MSNYHFGGVFTNYFRTTGTCVDDAEEFDIGIPYDVYICKVIYANPATIVFWSDDTKTICKCHGGDTYSKETGLSICILKKLVGSTKVKEAFKDWIPDFNKVKPEESYEMTLAKVRKNQKENS